ncbi:MAG: ribose 5-phosphate isomerase B [Alphaproteobacteria bacterium]
MTTEQSITNKTSGQTVILGSDHAGVGLKKSIANLLGKLGWQVQDVGAYDQQAVDYPDVAKSLVEKVLSVQTMGVLICGSGIGMSMAANRYKGIRAALCHDVTSTRLSRQHNNANVLVLGARLLGEDTALDMVEVFFTTPADNGERHQRRIAKMDEIG